jgi:hypothetical protein
MKAVVLYLRGSEHRNTVDARLDTVVFSYSPREISKFYETDSNSPQSMGAPFTTSIARRDDQRIRFGHQSAKAQLTGTLLTVARRSYRGDNNAHSFLISLSDIADYLGWTNNKVCNELQTLDGQAAISIGKSNQIALVDLQALQEMAA